MQAILAYDRRVSKETVYKLLIYIHKKVRKEVYWGISWRLPPDISLFSSRRSVPYLAHGFPKPAGPLGTPPSWTITFEPSSFRDRIHTYSLRSPNIWPHPRIILSLALTISGLSDTTPLSLWRERGGGEGGGEGGWCAAPPGRVNFDF